ncbi:patatin-like phospholipase family protein [Fusobacterium ulcerans]|uniref:patatin-like phospholipase family protein n=1 Tax=Fusobacterium ulcerans TaxID=861 RepID=UPI002E774BE0|nr:patatin-like phospholipase family protein [Fusobacterium ulcerans]MEE0139120.1 patatin-like phospholipase family protein [Fusobacterium ulcerans]
MIKKILIFQFILISSFSFSDTVQSKAYKVEAINKAIEELKIQQVHLELLKEKIESTDIDVTEKNSISKDRPKIALVLSGGGAKGAAHVGVLKVLEKYQIPLDIIIGTSIGSIVGGMYSIGYSSEEIEKTILNLKYTSLITNSKDRNLKNIKEKMENDKYPFTVSIDKNLKLSFPMGFLNGENIYLQLKEIFSRAENIKNFNNLPIQYRAITTDLETGKEVILKDGDLALATFKSMAIPSFLDPIEDNGKFYVDGGVVNNFPIDVAISLGADIIIAVDISAEVSKINEKSNIITILDKLATYNGNRKVDLHKRLADILIVPDVKEHSTIDFSNLSALVDEGEKAAEKYEYILKNLSHPQKFKNIKEKSLKEKPIFIKNIKLVGNEILTEEKVKDLMPKVNNSQFTRTDLNDWTKKVYSVSYIERAFYEINKNTIIFKVKEKDGININASFNYASNYGGSMNISATVPNLGLWTRNYTVKVEASSYPKITFNDLSFYELGKVKILNDASIGYSMSIGYEVDPLFIFSDANKVSTYKSNTFKTTLSLGTAVSNNTVIGLTLKYQNADNKYSSGSRVYRDFNESYQSLSTGIYLYIDTLNKKNFPSKGNILHFNGFNTQGVTGKEINYNSFMFSTDFYIPITEKISMNLGMSGGKTAGENVPNSSLFKLGGLRNNNLAFSFIGLPMMGRYADEFYMIRGGIQYRLTDTFYLIGKYNTMTYSSAGLSFQKSYDIGDRRYHGYGGGIGWDTFLGPISLMLSNDIDSSSSLFEVYMGYKF